MTIQIITPSSPFPTSRRFGTFVERLVGDNGAGPCKGISLARDAQQIATFLTDISNDDELVRGLLVGSYRHENGFTKLLLAVTPDDNFRLRLHFWPGTNQTDQNIHDHRFNFWSCVLSGQIVNNTWRDSPEGTEFEHYKYVARADSDSYRMERVGKRRLAESSQAAYQTGDIYHVDNGTLHTITSEEAPVTLLLEDRRKIRPYANVFTDRFGTDEVFMQSPSLSQAEYRDHLHRAVEILKRAV